MIFIILNVKNLCIYCQLESQFHDLINLFEFNYSEESKKKLEEEINNIENKINNLDIISQE